MALAIQVENVSKAYRIGEIGTGTLKSDFKRWYAKVRGKDDPFTMIGETNDRTTKGTGDIVWSLKDINFEIKEGEAVGIIGRNGAGKSTLLKLLSRVTTPTTGRISMKGRIASLLEVGTGFHPELTGRENVFLNGAILGMRKQEIARKFDEIVDFSGVVRYIDTPVRRYSSGMYVRLAFAVAAYLESEILIVDEVLAVGDIEFQKKCLGKMGEVSTGQGRTVLFVSHNMSAINNLCSKSILLNQGSMLAFAPSNEIITQYMQMGSEYFARKSYDDIVFTRQNPNLKICSIYLKGEQGIASEFGLEDRITIVIRFEVMERPSRVVSSVQLLDKYGECILASLNSDSANLGKDEFYNKVLSTGVYESSCEIPPHLLNDSSYTINVYVAPDETFMDSTIANHVLTFQTHDTGKMRKEYTGTWIGIIRPKLNWRTEIAPQIEYHNN